MIACSWNWYPERRAIASPQERIPPDFILTEWFAGETDQARRYLNGPDMWRVPRKQEQSWTY